jgi:hypothetical protein
LSLGFSLDCQDANPSCTDKGAVLLPQLKNALIIKTMSTSIYLRPNKSNIKNAQLLIREAYNNAKVDGELFTIKIVNPYNLKLTNAQTNSINVTAIKVVLNSGNRTAEIYREKDISTPVLLNTGITA